MNIAQKFLKVFAQFLSPQYWFREALESQIDSIGAWRVTKIMPQGPDYIRSIIYPQALFLLNWGMYIG